MLDDLRRYIADLDSQDYRPNTVEAYAGDLTRFARHFNDPPTSGIGRDHVVSYLLAAKERGLTASTRERMLRSIARFLEWCVERGVVGSNPAREVRAPRKPQRVHVFLTEEQVVQLLRGARAHNGYVGVRNIAILEMLYATGMRAGELCDMKLGDINGGTLRIMGKGGKERLVPVCEDAMSSLAAYLRLRPRCACSNVFLTRQGRPMRNTELYCMVRRYGRLAGLPFDIGPHIIRHSFTTHMLEGGCDTRTLQVMLGHSSIMTTEIYAQVTPGRLAAAHRQFHPRMRMNIS